MLLISTVLLLIASIDTGFELFKDTGQLQEQVEDLEQTAKANAEANHIDEEKVILQAGQTSLKAKGLDAKTEQLKLKNQELELQVGSLEQQMKQTEAYRRHCQNDSANKSRARK